VFIFLVANISTKVAHSRNIVASSLSKLICNGVFVLSMEELTFLLDRGHIFEVLEVSSIVQSLDPKKQLEVFFTWNLPLSNDF
jgi:hypothetical protein